MKFKKIYLVGSTSALAKELCKHWKSDGSLEIRAAAPSADFSSSEDLVENVSSDAIGFFRAGGNNHDPDNLIVFFNGIIDEQLPKCGDENHRRKVFDVNFNLPVSITLAVLGKANLKMNFIYLGSSVATRSASSSIYYSSSKAALKNFSTNMHSLYARFNKKFYFIDVGFCGLGINNRLKSVTNKKVFERQALKQFVSVSDLSTCICSIVEMPGVGGSVIKLDNGYT